MMARSTLPITAKLIGGPKDGEIIHGPASKVPGDLRFRSDFIKSKVHYYVLTEKYCAGGYKVHVFQYVGLRALD